MMSALTLVNPSIATEVYSAAIDGVVDFEREIARVRICILLSAHGMSHPFTDLQLQWRVGRKPSGKVCLPHP